MRFTFRKTVQMGLAGLVLMGFGYPASAQISDSIIPKSRRVDWIPGVTVGVSAGVSRIRNNLIDVTKAPYNADKTGATSASAAIQAAIDAAKSNDVVYLPTGQYRISSGLSLDKSYVTLRGDGPTNTVLLGITSASAVLWVGHDGLSTDLNRTYPVSGGATKGSTNLVLVRTTNAYGSPISAGDMLAISTETRNTGTESFPVISVANFDRIIRQVVVVSSISGNNVTLAAPLVWHMTNSPILTEMVSAGNASVRQAVGVESLGITLKHGTEKGSAIFQIKAASLQDSWFSDLDIGYANNYQLYFAGLVKCELNRSIIHDSLTSGSSHAGLILANATGCLVENNTFANGLFPAIEFNDATMGCAFAFNYFTNTSLDIDCHNTHPMMNLWEGNVLFNAIQMDGYFGSASHQTLFRNRIPSTTSFKRWTSNMNVVGNVLGSTNFSYVYYREESGYRSPYGIFEFGFPGMGNNNYVGSTPTIPWNYPGNTIMPFSEPWTPIPNGVYTFAEDQGPTNVLWGNFSTIPAAPGTALYALVFQDGVDTNKYHGAANGGPVVANSPGTSSNLTLNTSVMVKKGWTLYIGGQNAYQHLQAGDKRTHILQGNLVYTNVLGTVVWDPSLADHTLPKSILYPAGAPSWWGTNRWPAIDPLAANVTARIPAQNRYYGISNGEVVAPTKPAPPGSAPRVL